MTRPMERVVDPPERRENTLPGFAGAPWPAGNLGCGGGGASTVSTALSFSLMLRILS